MENLKIVAVKKDGSEIVQYKLSDGTIVDKDAILQYVAEGKLSGYMYAESKFGEGYLRSAADGDPSNSLGNLPEF